MEEKAKLLKKLNRFDEALEWFFLIIILFLSLDKALQLDPKNPEDSEYFEDPEDPENENLWE